MNNFFSRFGDSNWWLGENSLFGQGMQTIADSGAEFSVGGMSFGGVGDNITNIAGNEADFLKYGIIALFAYLVIKK
jgi:hypothetical protein